MGGTVVRRHQHPVPKATPPAAATTQAPPPPPPSSLLPPEVGYLVSYIAGPHRGAASLIAEREIAVAPTLPHCKYFIAERKMNVGEMPPV